jgi:hypothetical protein
VGYFIGLAGMWLLADAWYSLVLYWPKGESFWKCHAIRVIRLAIGVSLMVAGWYGR